MPQRPDGGWTLDDSEIAPVYGAPVKTHYAPDQPRDPAGTSTGGQWTGEGGETDGGDLGGFKVADRTVKLRTWEAQHATKPREHALVVRLDGTVVLDKAGKKFAVVFSNDEIARMEGATLTHNHPPLDPTGRKYAGGVPGMSFSRDDIIFAERARLGEMRVVTEQYVHTMQPGPQGWPSKSFLVAVVKTHSDAVAAEEKRSTEPLNVQVAERNHRVWERTAQDPRMRGRLRYTRMRREQHAEAA